MKTSRVASLVLVACVVVMMAADDKKPPLPAAGDVVSPPAAVIVPIPLPITGTVDTEVIKSVDKVLTELPPGDARPIVIFEFRRDDLQQPDTSSFERAFSLARYLASDRFSRVRTVAFVPTTIEGHAVLPVLACEEIIIAPDAQLGAAGRGESSIGPTMVAAYREIAERRRTVPVALVLGMLDANLPIVEVQLVGGGTRYVLPEELEALRAEAKIWKENTVVPVGDFVVISGRELRLKYGSASHLAADRKELAEALQIPPDSLRDGLPLKAGWKALRIDIRGTITARTADDVAHAIREAQSSQRANLMCIWVSSSGGSPSAAMRIVNLIADLDSREMRTIAFVDEEARSVAALPALVCDETYARADSQLGGPGDTFIGKGEIADLQESMREVARKKNRDWSMLQAMIDPQLEVFQCRQEATGVVRYFCDDELGRQENPGAWAREGKIDVTGGMTGTQAKEFGLLRDTVADFPAALRELNIVEDVAVAERNPVVAAIERLGAQPWFGRTLLFIAFFALISEASTPGLGVAGFVSGISFLLFFWCQFLNGTAGWLELMLFMGGLACIGLEIFVLPGFGVFGVGGGIMVLASIILASQTFIFPQNSYQYEQLPGSLFSMVAACGGVFAALWFMRRFLADSWLFSRLVLSPPSEDEELEELESTVDWDYLEGKRGVTTTQLTPSGKARFGDDVVNVISDGIVVPKGSPVYVSQVRGNRVLVEPVEES